MSPELVELEAELTRLTQQAKALTASLSETQLAASPPDGGWSVGECFIHLDKVGRNYADKIERAIDDAHTRGLSGKGPYRLGLMGWVFVRSQEPPVRVKIAAPKVFVPSDLAPLEGFTRYVDMHDILTGLVVRAEGLPLNRITITSSRLRLNLFETFHAFMAHERRHLWQAERIREALPDTP